MKEIELISYELKEEVSAKEILITKMKHPPHDIWVQKIPNRPFILSPNNVINLIYLNRNDAEQACKEFKTKLLITPLDTGPGGSSGVPMSKHLVKILLKNYIEKYSEDVGIVRFYRKNLIKLIGTDALNKVQICPESKPESTPTISTVSFI